MTRRFRDDGPCFLRLLYRGPSARQPAKLGLGFSAPAANANFILVCGSKPRPTLDQPTILNVPSDVGVCFIICAKSARLHDDEESGQSAEEDL